MKHLVIILSIFAMAIGADTKIGGTTYFDYTSGKDDAGESTSAFNFKRQYISFSGEASDDIKYKIVVDVGATNKLDGEDRRLTAFLKKAQIDYKTSFANISMGVIGTNTYGVQEKNWGYRFIEKSSMDLYGFSSTADIGIGFSKSLIFNSFNISSLNSSRFSLTDLIFPFILSVYSFIWSSHWTHWTIFVSIFIYTYFLYYIFKSNL